MANLSTAPSPPDSSPLQPTSPPPFPWQGRVAPPSPAGESPRGSPAQAFPPVFPALVSGHTPRGDALLASPAGLLVMEGDAQSLPQGTRLELSLVSVREAASFATQEDPLPPPSRPTDWPELQELAAQIPRPLPVLQTMQSNPAHVGGALLFLLAALGLRDVKNMIGEEITARLLAAGQHEKLARLSAEMEQVGKKWLHTETRASRNDQEGVFQAPAQQNDWKSLSLPVPPDSPVLRLAVHLREEQRDDGTTPDRKKYGKHLVVEVEMSRLGAMVFDGFIVNKRFDLTLRSQRLIPPPLRQELHIAFNDSLAAMEWHGHLQFHSAAELWLGQ